MCLFKVCFGIICFFFDACVFCFLGFCSRFAWWGLKYPSWKQKPSLPSVALVVFLLGFKVLPRVLLVFLLKTR